MWILLLKTLYLVFALPGMPLLQVVLWLIVSKLELLDLTNKNLEHPVRLELQTHNGFMLYKYIPYTIWDIITLKEMILALKFRFNRHPVFDLY